MVRFLIRREWFTALVSTTVLGALGGCGGDDSKGGPSCPEGACGQDAAATQDASIQEEAAAAGAGVEDATAPDADAAKATAPDAGAPDAFVPDARVEDATSTDATSMEASSDASTACEGDLGCPRCSDHADCTTSNVCLPDGSCADPSQVAYVDPSGTDNAQCSLATPCTRVAAALATNRPYLKLRGTTDEAVTIGRDVTLLADPGAKLTNTNGGLQGAAVLTVLPNSQAIDVRIDDLEVTGAAGPYYGWGIDLPSNSGVHLALTRVKVTNNANGGIMGNGGALTLSQCTVTGNGLTGTSAFGYGDRSGVYVMETALTVTGSTVAGNGTFGVYLFGHGVTVSQCAISGNVVRENPAGGLEVLNATSVDIVNNFFFANGSGTSSGGGLIVDTVTPANPPVPSRLEFNSFSRNLAKDGVGSAIQCGAGVTLAARNDILSGNGTSTNLEQVGGPCTHMYSIVQPGALPSGAGNLATDPAFRDVAAGDLHLQPGSPALGAADPSSDLAGLAGRDIDGDARTIPADIGADEAP
jgi:hypothetical protein